MKKQLQPAVTLNTPANTNKVNYGVGRVGDASITGKLNLSLTTKASKLLPSLGHAITSATMLIEEAEERASKPWYRKIQ